MPGVAARELLPGAIDQAARRNRSSRAMRHATGSLFFALLHERPLCRPGPGARLALPTGGVISPPAKPCHSDEVALRMTFLGPVVKHLAANRAQLSTIQPARRFAPSILFPDKRSFRYDDGNVRGPAVGAHNSKESGPRTVRGPVI